MYFDDFKVEHIKSPVISSQDYYPFGLTYNSSSRENSLANQYKFQGQEYQDELDLGWESFTWRNHMPEIGRFFNIDPLADKYVYNSPYAFSENQVTSHVELEGLEKADPKDPGDNQPKKPGLIESILTTVFQELNASGKALNTAFGNPNASEAENITAIVPMLMTAPMEAEQMIMESGGSAESNALSKTDEVANKIDDGVNLVVKGKSSWTASQNSAAATKAQTLTDDVSTVVTHNPVARESNLRSKFIKAGGQVSTSEHVDHKIDLQLGGTNAMSNLGPLDKSVNMSFGSQINKQIKMLPDATRVNKVTFIPHGKK